jgi:hypothetical protein
MNDALIEKALKKSELEHGEYYYGTCRNSDTARWNSKDEKFYYRRQKFGTSFIDDIRHPEDDDVFDVFIPLHKIDYSVEEIRFEDVI